MRGRTSSILDNAIAASRIYGFPLRSLQPKEGEKKGNGETAGMGVGIYSRHWQKAK